MLIAVVIGLCAVAAMLLLAASIIIALPKCDYTAGAKAALSREARFSRVRVESGYMGFAQIIIIEGVTKTEADKWDARNAVWHYHVEHPACRPEGINEPRLERGISGSTGGCSKSTPTADRQSILG